MNFSENILIYSSIFVWLLPPVRQYKNFLFRYFLILGIADILVLFFNKILLTPFPDLYITISFILFVALQKNEYLKKKKSSFYLLKHNYYCFKLY